MARSAPENARTVALDALSDWDQRRLPMDRMFSSRAARLDPAERRLARSLVYGTLRKMEILDAIVAQYSRHPLDKMDPKVRMALRVGALQLLEFSRIPASAAVNATIDALKRARPASWLVGFVNGVLRQIARDRDNLGRFALDAAGRPRTSHPAWLCERWLAAFGEEAMRAICALNNTEPSLTLRANIRRMGRADLVAALRTNGISVQPGVFSPVAVAVDRYPGPIRTLFGYEPGFFQVQDEGAQLIGLLLGGFSGPVRVLDACAGLGGKTSHLAELLPAASRITALEPDSYRFRMLQENLARLGHGMGPDQPVHPIRAALDRFVREWAAHSEKFDAILVDAPCSGTGVIRRQPDIRWNRQPADPAQCALLQETLLRQAGPLLKPGGLLVYATCSLEPEENQQVVDRFLAAHPVFVLEDAGPHLPENARRLARDSCLATRPTDGCDGFFAACLRRRG